ncbi:MAG: hypothetical protein ACPG47_04100, partial [Leucothrix sp.]
MNNLVFTGLLTVSLIALSGCNKSVDLHNGTAHVTPATPPAADNQTSTGSAVPAKVTDVVTLTDIVKITDVVQIQTIASSNENNDD